MDTREKYLVKSHLFLGKLWRSGLRDMSKKTGTYNLVKKSYAYSTGLLTPREHVVEIGGNPTIFPVSGTPDIQAYRMIEGEKEVLEDLLEELETGDLFYDIGAYYGTYSCIIANNREDVDVVSFEPNPLFREKLGGNINANTIPVKINDFGASDKDSEAFIEDMRVKEKNSLSAKHVKLRRLDTLKAPDVIKIDVEGMEKKVVDGLGENLGRVRALYIETHTETQNGFGMTDKEFEDLLSLLKKNGFQIENISNPRGQDYLKAVQK